MESIGYKKAYLQLYRDYKAIADDDQIEFERIDALKNRIKISTYGFNRSGKKTTFEDWICDLENVIERVTESARNAQDMKQEIRAYIMTLSNPDERRILQLCYIDGKAIPVVIKMMNFSRSRVFQIRDNALEHLPDPHEFSKQYRENSLKI